MSKETWFREYEALVSHCEAEGLDLTDDELSDAAYERMREREAERIDRAGDERIGAQT